MVTDGDLVKETHTHTHTLVPNTHLQFRLVLNIAIENGEQGLSERIKEGLAYFGPCVGIAK